MQVRLANQISFSGFKSGQVRSIFSKMEETDDLESIAVIPEGFHSSRERASRARSGRASSGSSFLSVDFPMYSKMQLRSHSHPTPQTLRGVKKRLIP